MEYVFGTERAREILRTKGSAHSELNGLHSVEQVYPDMTVTDRFRVVKKLDSKEDAAGNCYDWYEIDQHSIVRDRSESIKRRVEKNETTLENALCELDAAAAARIGEIETALCELDTQLMGGTVNE